MKVQKVEKQNVEIIINEQKIVLGGADIPVVSKMLMFLGDQKIASASIYRLSSLLNIFDAVKYGYDSVEDVNGRIILEREAENGKEEGNND
jgi:hypothetical protein